MRAAVKEKDAKIEQLMKERNLERQEIAKAASQTEQVEENLEQVRLSQALFLCNICVVF